MEGDRGGLWGRGREVRGRSDVGCASSGEPGGEGLCNMTTQRLPITHGSSHEGAVPWAEEDGGVFIFRPIAVLQQPSQINHCPSCFHGFILWTKS